jgi:tRNA(fMet)-specific endonuclease VapC
MVVLDTDHMSLLEWSDARGSATLRARLRVLQPAEEQMRGWMAYLARTRSIAQQMEAYPRLYRQLQNYCQIPVLTFDEEAAVTFQRLRRARLRMGTMDLKIAAIVLSRDATLLSRNLADFHQVCNFPDSVAVMWTLYVA